MKALPKTRYVTVAVETWGESQRILLPPLMGRVAEPEARTGGEPPHGQCLP
jgi:hypothetical protein